MISSLKIIFFSLFIIFGYYSSYCQSYDYDDWQLEFNKAIDLIESGSRTEAYPYLENAYFISKEIFEFDDEELKKTAIRFAQISSQLKKNKKAVELYTEVLKITQKQFDTITQIQMHKELGLCFKRRNNKNALDEFKKAKSLLEKLNKEESIEYANMLYHISSIHKYENQYEDAIKILDSSSVITQRVIDSTRQYPKNLTMLSQIYLSAGHFEKAIPIQERALSFYVSEDDKSTIDYAAALFTMAVLYHEFDEYEKEINIYKEVMLILGEEHPQYDHALNNIAQAYDRMGDYENALKYIDFALLKVDKGIPDYPIRLQNKAFLMVTLGNYNDAELIYKEAQDIMATMLGTSHPEYGKLLNNIGKLYFKNRDLELAEQFFKEALDIFLLNYDENDKRYSYQLNDYAQTLYEKGEKNTAIKLIEQNLSIQERNERTDTQNYYVLQRSLANIYYQDGEYEKALYLQENSVKNTGLISGKEHPLYRKSLFELSRTYLALNDSSKALNSIEEFNTLLISQLNDVFKFRSEIEKKLFLKTVINNFDELQTIRFEEKEYEDRINIINLNNQLILKGLLLSNSRDLLHTLSNLNDSLVDGKLINYKSLNRKRSRLVAMPLDKRKESIDSINTLINNREVELVKLYHDIFNETESFNKDWLDIRNKLNSNEVVIEFSSYMGSSNDTSTNEKNYIAYVFDKNSKTPELVDLFNENEFIEMVNKSSQNKVSSTRGSHATNISNNTRLYELIIGPLKKFIQNAATIYYSPSGVLNQISFSALSPSTDKFLIDEFNLIQLSNSFNLVDSKPILNSNIFLLIGGLNYNMTGESASHINSTEEKKLTINDLKGTSSFNTSWQSLPGTLDEILSIKTTLSKSEKEFDIWSDAEATETRFKALSGNSPNIIHVATHGYFFESPDKLSKNNKSENISIYQSSEDPLIRSGLIFSGANHSWKNGLSPKEIDDGILTGLELTHLDFSNTQLVVLSACETGLGDVEGSEGVYGLQRAFKMAGVENIIMSLWQVPDKETAEFMNLFYELWIENKKDISMAFNETQRVMCSKYKSQSNKWAAFVLTR